MPKTFSSPEGNFVVHLAENVLPIYEQDLLLANFRLFDIGYDLQQSYGIMLKEADTLPEPNDIEATISAVDTQKGSIVIAATKEISVFAVAYSDNGSIKEVYKITGRDKPLNFREFRVC